AGTEVLRAEVEVAPVPLRPGALPRQVAGQRPLVERNPSDHRHVQLAAHRKQLVLRCLIEDVVDHLDSVDESGPDRIDAVPWLPPVEAQADSFDQPLHPQVVYDPLPSLVLRPGVFPDVELKQVYAIDAEVVEALLRVFPDVVGREDVVELEPTT